MESCEARILGMSDDPDPTHEVWWNDMLVRARANEAAPSPSPSSAGPPPA